MDCSERRDWRIEMPLTAVRIKRRVLFLQRCLLPICCLLSLGVTQALSFHLGR